MTNKPMLSVERELLERVAQWGSVSWSDKNELRALLDKPAESVIDLDALDWESVKEAAAESKWMPPEYMRNDWVADVCAFLRSEPAAQHQVESVYMVRSHGSDCWEEMSGESLEMCQAQPAEYEVRKLYAEQPAPVADHTQCEECKGWGHHEKHHEGGGTECGECGGSGNATVAVVMPDVDELAQIIRKVDGSHTLGAGSLAEAIIEEVSRLNGVKP